MKKIIIILFMLTIASSAFAQGQFLKQGEQAFGVGVGVQKFSGYTRDLTFLELSFGSNGSNSTFDIGFLIGNSSGTNFYGIDLNTYLINQKNNETSPISLGILFKAEFAKNDFASATAFAGGGFLTTDFKLSPDGGIQPFFMAYYAIANNTQTATAGGGVSIYFGKKMLTAIEIGFYSTENANAFVMSFSIFGKSKIGTKANNEFYID